MQAMNPENEDPLQKPMELNAQLTLVGSGLQENLVRKPTARVAVHRSRLELAVGLVFLVSRDTLIRV